MSGEAKVRIRETEWDCALATTYAEMREGLGGVESIEAGEGMLFDYGENTYISVTTEPMLFNIDIVFIRENVLEDGSLHLYIAEYVSDAEPDRIIEGHTDCRYFLEVNAGEVAAAGVEVGDEVEVTIIIEKEVLDDLMGMFMGVSVAGIMAAAVAGVNMQGNSRYKNREKRNKLVDSQAKNQEKTRRQK